MNKFLSIALFALFTVTHADDMADMPNMSMSDNTMLKSLISLHYKPPQTIPSMNNNPITYDNTNTIQLGQDDQWNDATIQISTYSDASDTAGRPYTYMLRMLNEQDYTITIENTDHMAMPPTSMHMHRMLMLQNNDVAPVCTSNDISQCMTSYHSMRIHCVKDGDYPMQLMINDINTGHMLVQNFMLGCKLKPFGARGDLGHLGPAVPGFIYFTISMILWAYASRKAQYLNIDTVTRVNNDTNNDVLSELSTTERRTSNHTQQTKQLNAWLSTSDYDVYIWIVIGFFVFAAHAYIVLVLDDANGIWDDMSNVMHALVGLWMCATGMLHLVAKRAQKFTFQETPDSASVVLILPFAYMVMAALFMMHGQSGVLDMVIHQMFSYTSAVLAVMYILAVNRRDNMPFMLSYWAVAHINVLSFCCACEYMLTHNKYRWGAVNYCFTIALVGVLYTVFVFVSVSLFVAAQYTVQQARINQSLQGKSVVSKLLYIIQHTYNNAMYRDSITSYSQLTEYTEPTDKIELGKLPTTRPHYTIDMIDDTDTDDKSPLSTPKQHSKHSLQKY